MTKSMIISKYSETPLESEDQEETSDSKSRSVSLDLALIGPFGLLLIGALVTLPLFFGGRGAIANSVVKTVFYLSFMVSAIYYLFSSGFKNGVGSKFSMKTILVASPLMIYLGFQLVPLPLSFLQMLSPDVATAYFKSSAENGYLSVDPLVSMQALSWLLMFVLLFSLLVKIPYRAIVVKGARVSRNKRKTVLLSPSAREYDFFSELLQVVLIRVSLLCALIGLSHLALQMKALFGVFSFTDNFIPTTRAHWPFVNANQLAVMIEVGLLLAFSRHLRDRHLRNLTLSSPKDSGFIKTILQILTSTEKQAKSLMTILVLALCLLLTMSRAGIFLSFVGMSSIWLAYKFHPVFIVSASRSRPSNKKNKPSLLFNLLLPGIAFLVLLSFLGGEAVNDLSGRVSETYAEGGSAPRWELNQVSKNIISSNLLFGVGLNCWQLVAPSYSSTYLSGWKLDYAHNDYLQFFSEVGLIGVILCFLPIVLGLKYFLKLAALNINQVQKVFLIGIMVTTLVPVIHAAADFPYHLPILSMVIFSSLVILSRTILFLIEQDKVAAEKYHGDPSII